MNEKNFLFYYLVLTPIMIWSATFILAIIRIWHKNHRDLTEERKKWEDQNREPTYRVRERRVIRRRRRRRRSTDTSKTGTTGNTTGNGGGNLNGEGEGGGPETQKLIQK